MTHDQLLLLDTYLELRTQRALADARVVHMSNEDYDALNEAVEKAWWKLVKAMED